MKNFFLYFFFVLTVNVGFSPSAVFGSFQLRIDDFGWQITETPNLYIYHYPLEKDKFEIKPFIDRMEVIYEKVTENLNVVFPKKPSIFLFYSHSHFQQNAIAAVGDGTEGFAELFKSRMAIPVRHSHYDMDHLIAHELVHVAQFEILYGGFWRSPKLIKGLSGLQPIWIIEGMAESIAHCILKREWSSFDKMILRDAVLYDYLYSLRELQNFGAIYRRIWLGYKQGHSAMDFFVKEEGEDANFRLLKELRNHIDPTTAFEEASEQFASFRDFDIKWRRNTEEKVAEFIKGKDKVTDIAEVLISDYFHSRNPVCGGANGIYFISDRHLQNEIFLRLPDGREKNILPNFFGTNVDNITIGRRFDRIIDFNKQKNLIVFAAEKNHRNYIFLFNPSNENIKKIDLNLTEIRSPSFSTDGERIVFTALDNNKRNIFIYNIKSQKLTLLTDDAFIDYAPIFYGADDYVLASTERNLNTDLRLISIETGEYIWLTRTPYNEIHAAIYDNVQIYFSADRNSVYNIFSAKLFRSTSTEFSFSLSTAVALTNIRGGAFFPMLTEKGNILAACYFNESFKIIEFNEFTEVSLKNNRQWITELSTATILATDLETRPYRFKFSTDFFLPSFLYSTDIGFIGGGFYRGSDYLSHHNINIFGWALPRSYEISAQYDFRGWRPDISIAFDMEAEEYFFDDDKMRDTQKNFILQYRYPFTSNFAVTNWLKAGKDSIKNISQDEKVHKTELGAGITLERKNVFLKPFHILKGSIFTLSAYRAMPHGNRSLIYNQFESRLRKYIPFTGKLTLANNLFLGRIEGTDGGVFTLDARSRSPYRLRGYGRNVMRGPNIISLSNELRYMLFDDINWHWFFIFPDINIHSMSISAFLDTGSAFDDDYFPRSLGEFGVTGGFGIKLNIYFLQLAPVFIKFETARPLNENRWRNYWTFASGFVTW